MSNDVAIIGVGLHPFGRFEKTAMQMGAEAIAAGAPGRRRGVERHPVRLRRQL